MNEKTYNEVLDEKSPKVKQLYWNIAFGLQDVDRLRPSKYMVELTNEHIDGKKTYKEVKDNIKFIKVKNFKEVYKVIKNA